MAVCSEAVISKKVEILAKNCGNYYQLVDRFVKSEKSEDFVIIYDFGEYQMIIDCQEALDEALKQNGRKLLIELILQNRKEAEVEVKPRNITNIPEFDANSLDVETKTHDRVSNDGTLCGKSFNIPSTSSRYSENLTRPPKKYRIGKKLGEGTLGQVYIAEAKRGGTYAVKIIKKYGRHRPQEADVHYLKQLRNERIVECLYIVEAENSNEIHILMELMISGNLKDYIEKHAPLEEDLLRCYIKQIAEGLDFLHSKHIIHQDLKPANLLLNNTHYKTLIKIADFGSSRFSKYRKNGGQQGGTPKYTPPEVSTGREIAGRRTDIWSFGVIIIEMFTGKYPWDIEGQPPIVVSRTIEENPPKILIPRESDKELEILSRKMVGPISTRPYASEILRSPVLDETRATEDDDSDNDFF